MSLAGPSINLKQNIPIVIGSIPLRNTFQEIFTLQSSSPSPMPMPMPNSVNHVTIPLPSAPAQSVLFTDDIRANYPDLPPPTYQQVNTKYKVSFKMFIWQLYIYFILCKGC